MASGVPVDRRWLIGTLLLLTGVTGLIDAVSYLSMGRVFVANMTGNVLFAGFALQAGSGLSAEASIGAVLGFALGALVGGRLGGWLAPPLRPWLITSFTLHAGVLEVVTVLSATGLLPYRGPGGLLAVGALSMSFGLQTATVRRLSVESLNTTVITMTLTGLVAGSTLGGGSGAKTPRRIGAVLALLAGAALGAAMLRYRSVTAVLALGAGLVVVVILIVAAAPDAAPEAGEGRHHAR